MSAFMSSLCLSLPFTILLVAMVTHSIDDQPYCAMRYRRLCQGKGLHVACQFPEPGPGPLCDNYTLIKFTSELKHFITRYTNRRRQRIAAGHERVRGGAHLPRPEIMMQVEWDRELAMLAQRLADQCTFAHDNCRATVRYPYAGQTVGEVRWRRSSDSDELTAQLAIRRVLDAWWGERRRVDPKQLTAPFRLYPRGTVWGHFSQLAVWTLQAMGCGAVRHGIDYPRLLLVCDFSHTNMLGQRTISPGPLTRCPVHTARRQKSAFPLLCAPVRYKSLTTRQEENFRSGESHYEDVEIDEEDDFLHDGIDDDPKMELIVIENTVAERIGEFVTVKSTTIITDKFTVTTEDDDNLLNFRGDLKNRSINRITTVKDIEFDNRNKMDGNVNKNKEEFLELFREWRTRRPYHREWHDQRSDKGQFERNRKLKTNPDDVVSVPEYYRPLLRSRNGKKTTELGETDKVNHLLQEIQYRQKWKYSRSRPRRPGANALLSTPYEKVQRRFSVASLRLDKDDVDQLFRDTGFKPLLWKKPVLQ